MLAGKGPDLWPYTLLGDEAEQTSDNPCTQPDWQPPTPFQHAAKLLILLVVAAVLVRSSPPRAARPLHSCLICLATTLHEHTWPRTSKALSGPGTRSSIEWMSRCPCSDALMLWLRPSRVLHAVVRCAEVLLHNTRPRRFHR